MFLATLYFVLPLMGYVPQRFCRIGTTYGDDSVACMTSYHNATQRSKDAQNERRYIAATTPKLPYVCSNEAVLQAFYYYNYKHHPYVLGKMYEDQVSKVPDTNQRFYRPEGMLPKYSSHIPHKHLVIGKTFGNLYRSRSVHTHIEESYGAHLTKERNATLTLPKNLKCNMKS